MIQSNSLKQEQVDAAEPNTDEYFNHYYINEGNLRVKYNWYAHFIRNHLHQYIKFWWYEFGLGYGIFSTQGSEHKNKEFKFALVHSNNGPNRFREILINDVRHKWYFMQKEIDKPVEKRKCGNCDQPGHFSQNCPNEKLIKKRKTKN